MDSFTQFHFLRPWWLLLLIAALAAFWWQRGARSSSGWNQVVDAHLLPHLLGASTRGVARGRQWFLPIFLTFLSLSLAGPTYRQIASQSNLVGRPLIVVLELSNHMLSTDISPSRLKRALYKLKDLLAEERGREISLIAFAGDAHVVVPLTTDHRTILSLSEDLSPNIMPIAGAKLLSALKEGASMAENADILVMTSSNIEEQSETVRKFIEDNRLRVIFWTFATEAGAPTISSDGRFDAARNGSVAISSLRRDWLGDVAKSSQVSLLDFSAGDSDIKAIHRRLGQEAHESASGEVSAFDSWQDLGPYILVLALVVFLLASAFYGPQWWMLACFLWLPGPEAHASISDWFLRADQRAYAVLKDNPEQAAELYQDDYSKGTALFKAKKYEEAAKYLAQVNTSDGRYNLGNALAHLNKIPEAIAAYTEALKLDAKNLDAQHNKEILEKLLKDNEKNEQKQQNQDDKESKPEEKKDEKSEQNQEPKEQEQKGSNQNKGDDKKEGESKAGEKEPQPEEKASDSKSSPPEEEKKSEQSLGKPEEKKPEPGQEKKGAVEPKEEAVDPNTLYYFDQLEQNNNFYLKRKFLHESRNKVRGH